MGWTDGQMKRRIYASPLGSIIRPVHGQHPPLFSELDSKLQVKSNKRLKRVTYTFEIHYHSESEQVVHSFSQYLTNVQ